MKILSNARYNPMALILQRWMFAPVYVAWGENNSNDRLAVSRVAAAEAE